MHKQNNKGLDLFIPSASEGRREASSAFTLIEFLVVLSIIVFIVPSVFGLMYSLLRQQGRIIALQEVKRQGDLAFNNMKVAIKNNAFSIYSDSAGTTPICVTSTPPTNDSGTLTSMYFLDANTVSTYFGYRLNGTTLEYLRTSSAATSMSNSSVTISDLALRCTKNSDFAAPIVSVSFTVTQPANNVSLSYKTLIKLNSH